MSDADDSKKKPKQPTVQWDPNAPQPTMQWDPDASEPGEEGGGQGPPRSEEEEDSLVGTLLRDKWKVLQRLGAGSFGTVYKVQDVKGGWIEALKILGVDRITGSEADTVRKRFLREAQIMKRLGTQSQHIVGLSTYEEDLEAGLIYFLMEFVEGRSLADTLAEEGPFDPDRTLRLALQICEALVVAHEDEDGVVHRDLKLENVMLTQDRAGNEMAKVLDFGIAKLAEREADSRLTTVGTLGTPGFAAPEQLRAEEVDGRTDLFAFGVILYCLLTGRDPWFGNRAWEPTTQIYELMVATEKAEMRPFSETGTEVPPALANVVKRLLQRNADDRFATARELKEALERISQGGEALEAGFIKVLTEEPGVEVEVRSGRQVVARGPTPCMANGVMEGTYRVLVTDSRFEPSETTVTVAPGAMEDVTLLTVPRKGGVAGTLKRRMGTVAAVAVLVLIGVGVVLVQPWGRTLTLEEVRSLAGEGRIDQLRLTSQGLEGALSMGPIPAPFAVSFEADRAPEVVEELRAAGLGADTSWEVARLIRQAQEAQARMWYFGREGEDVRSLALRARALEPESPEAGSLLLKVAVRMSWDAEAAEAEGDQARAQELRAECLSLVPDHPGCLTPSAGEG